MKVALLLKAIPDLSQARYSRSERKLQEKGERLLSPVGENVLEAAREIKAADASNELLGVLLGNAAEESALKKAIAFGLDRAAMITGNVDEYDPSLKAAVLTAALKKLGPVDLLIVGDASEMGNGGQVGLRVAEALELSTVLSVADALKVKKGVLVVARGSNQPKIPNVMAVMKAGSKEITRLKAEELAGEDARRATVAREEWVA